MTPTLAVSLPVHLYGYVDRRALSAGQREGWEAAVWYGLTTPANRAFGLSVLLECGAMYRAIPPHAWAFTPDAEPEWTLQQAQAWDGFGGVVQAIEYAYLRELAVRVIKGGYQGTYRFTVEFGDDGFSRHPAQSKCLHAIELDNGRLTLQPNDRLIWHEGSFTKDGDVSWLRRQDEAYWVEEWPVP